MNIRGWQDLAGVMFCFSYSFAVVHCCAKSQICKILFSPFQVTGKKMQEEIKPIKNLPTEHFISPMYQYA